MVFTSLGAIVKLMTYTVQATGLERDLVFSKRRSVNSVKPSLCGVVRLLLLDLLPLPAFVHTC